MTRLVHISDPHFGSIVPGSVEALLAAVGRLRGDLVVVSGDLTLSGRSDEFIEARAFLDRINEPTLVVPGNHDVPAYNLLQRFVDPLGHYKRYIDRKVDSVHVDDDMVALGLNTARAWDLSWNWSHGRFSSRQVRAADRVFEKHADKALKCLVMHHPFVVPDTLPGFKVVGRGERMLGVLAEHRVDFALSGHLHHGFWRSHEIRVEPLEWRVLVIQASTATSTRRREHANAFNEIVVDGDELVLTPWESHGDAFMPARSSRFARLEHGWTPVEGPAVVATEEETVVAAPAEEAGAG